LVGTVPEHDIKRDRMITRGAGPKRVGLPIAIAIALSGVALLAVAPSAVDAHRRTVGTLRQTVAHSWRGRSLGITHRRWRPTYDRVVLAQKPVIFLTMGNAPSGREPDASGRGHDGVYLPASSTPRTVWMPNGDAAAEFDGYTQYLQVPDSTALSVPRTGVLTISAWIRPDTLQFPVQEGTGFVNLLGKCEYAHVNQCEYEMRMYSETNTENPVRPNRLCAYAFNLNGGEGSGSYVQDPVTVGRWIMVVTVVNTRAATPTAPTGYVRIFKDGVWRQTVALTQFGVTPQHGTAPFRVGSVELYSYFMGAIGKVAVFDYELTPAQVAAEYAAMAR
jgi:hypothetical protein